MRGVGWRAEQGAGAQRGPCGRRFHLAPLDEGWASITQRLVEELHPRITVDAHQQQEGRGEERRREEERQVPRSDHCENQLHKFTEPLRLHLNQRPRVRGHDAPGELLRLRVAQQSAVPRQLHRSEWHGLPEDPSRCLREMRDGSDAAGFSKTPRQPSRAPELRSPISP